MNLTIIKMYAIILLYAQFLNAGGDIQKAKKIENEIELILLETQLKSLEWTDKHHISNEPARGYWQDWDWVDPEIQSKEKERLATKSTMLTPNNARNNMPPQINLLHRNSAQITPLSHASQEQNISPN